MTTTNGKDFDPLADLDMSKLCRGKTPEDIKDQCRQLCSEFLGGVWAKVSDDELEVRRLTGGLTNQLYYCALTNKSRVFDHQPREVLVRLYGDKHYNNLNADDSARLPDVVISLIASEMKWGPKIYGIFNNGLIMKYYKHRQFRKNEFLNAKLLNELGRKLAQMHAQSVPLRKTNNWYADSLDAFYDKAYQLFPIDEYIDECDYETLKRYNLSAEKQWLKRLIERTGSPTVFCHNDFRGSNIMVLENDSGDDQRLIICDFDYSSYGYRGVDFGILFSEWGFEDINDIKKDWIDFPDELTLRNFIDGYVDESAELLGAEYKRQEINSAEQLLTEIKVFVLANKMFMALLSLQFNDDSLVEFTFDKKASLVYTERMYKNYYMFKNKFIAEGVIDE